jgi:signal transduction histidine kinase/CheY-like chemotaxis protein
VQAKDGRQLWVATNGIPLLNGDGTLRGYRGSDTDITERQMAEAELIKAKGHAEESDRLKTAFLNNISHEIRTPLNGILGFLSLLEDDTLSAGKKSEYAGMINQSADRLMNIISDTIEMSKIQTGQVKINLVETDINRLSRDLFEQFKQQAETKGLNFTLKNSLSSAYYSIKTDDDKLNSVLGILINNAIKFTQTGSVELEITRNETFLEFSVKDTGPGIPENKRQRIFECFMQADVSNTRKFEGAGLGLAIAQAHVKMLGSDIRFESQEGQGSTFYVTLPYQLTEPGKVCDPQPETPEVVMHAQQFLKILVAEDDEINFDYVNAILTKANYVVLHAWTGVEAVELCRKHADIDIILMDIKMPVMDGYIATSEIRKFNLAIPIIAITAYAAAGDRQNSMDAGMNDYVSKPIKQQALLAVLDKWFPLEYPDVKQEI